MWKYDRLQAGGQTRRAWTIPDSDDEINRSAVMMGQWRGVLEGSGGGGIFRHTSEKEV